MHVSFSLQRSAFVGGVSVNPSRAMGTTAPASDWSGDSVAVFVPAPRPSFDQSYLNSKIFKARAG